jgi:SAM-dependent methyltransferase
MLKPVESLPESNPLDHASEFSQKKMHCAICGPAAPADMLLPANFSVSDLDFAARKVPLGMHFSIMKCRVCGLVYSSPIIAEEKMIQLYREMGFIDEMQLHNMRIDYVKQFKAAIGRFENCRSLLEIGCSNGFFLKAARSLGIENVRGVEPSKQSIAHAPDDIRPCIVNDTFHAGLFEPRSFDVVCFFQVFDHIIDPNQLLVDIKRVLRPGGMVIAIHHNIRSLFARCFGPRSPMYDVEHIYLFDLKTSATLFRKHGFEVIKTANIANWYALEYAVKMFPFPHVMKVPLLKVLALLRLQHVAIPMSAGNMISIARLGKTEAVTSP